MGSMATRAGNTSASPATRAATVSAPMAGKVSVTLVASAGRATAPERPGPLTKASTACAPAGRCTTVFPLASVMPRVTYSSASLLTCTRAPSSGASDAERTDTVTARRVSPLVRAMDSRSPSQPRSPTCTRAITSECTAHAGSS